MVGYLYCALLEPVVDCRLSRRIFMRHRGVEFPGDWKEISRKGAKNAKGEIALYALCRLFNRKQAGRRPFLLYPLPPRYSGYPGSSSPRFISCSFRFSTARRIGFR